MRLYVLVLARRCHIANSPLHAEAVGGVGALKVRFILGSSDFV
jgi:hypothetical protein